MKKNKFQEINNQKNVNVEEIQATKKFIAHKIKPIGEIDAETDFEALQTTVSAALLSKNDDSPS